MYIYIYIYIYICKEISSFSSNIDHAVKPGLLMSIIDLLYFCDNYAKTTGCLYQYVKGNLEIISTVPI